MADGNYRVATKRTYAQWLAEKRAASPYGFYCETCGAYAVRQLGGTNRALGSRNRWCSMACRKEQAQRTRNEIAAIRRMGAAGRALAKRVESALVVVQRAAISAQRFAQRASVPCKVCGNDVGYGGMGPTRAYCSPDCARNSEARKAAKRSARLARKALTKARTVERFDPVSVLERDKWRCQICGRKTPRRKRGTFDDDAPELDHVVPLSMGGEHSRSNTQCACRRCNQEKSGARALGQLSLAGV